MSSAPRASTSSPGALSAHASAADALRSDALRSGAAGALAGSRADLGRVEAKNRPLALQVGRVRVAPAVLLAPMEGVTDIAFRRVVRQQGGVGLTCTEFLPSSGVATGKARRIMRMAEFDPDERPVSCQLYGREPAVMAAAAVRLEACGFDLIDVNMGCPSKKVFRNSGGSALMAEPRLAAALVRAVKTAVDIPVTVKMRAGVDSAARNAPEVAWACQEEGAAAITIHWRTRADRYGGVRDLGVIAEAVSRLSVPVIGNGDVIDIDSARTMLDETGCAGLMVGRGAIRNPWLLRQIADWLAGAAPFVPNVGDKRRLVDAYVDAIVDSFEHQDKAIGRVKMVVRQFSDSFAQGEALRQAVLRCEDVPQARVAIDDFFASSSVGD